MSALLYLVAFLLFVAKLALFVFCGAAGVILLITFVFFVIYFVNPYFDLEVKR